MVISVITTISFSLYIVVVVVVVVVVVSVAFLKGKKKESFSDLITLFFCEHTKPYIYYVRRKEGSPYNIQGLN